MEQQGTNPPFIVTDGLTKTYIRREKPENGGITRLWRRETREVQALRDVSFRIGRGELVGLIGPNGAGKSTLVKLMTGILTPTSGSCTVDGHAVGRAEGTCARPRCGVRAADAALVGRADSRFVRPPARHLQH